MLLALAGYSVEKLFLIGDLKADSIPALRREVDAMLGPKPSQTGEDLSCTAATVQSLTRKALAQSIKPYFLHSQHAVFPQNRDNPDFRRNAE